MTSGFSFVLDSTGVSPFLTGKFVSRVTHALDSTGGSTLLAGKFTEGDCGTSKSILCSNRLRSNFASASLLRTAGVEVFGRNASGSQTSSKVYITVNSSFVIFFFVAKQKSKDPTSGTNLSRTRGV